MTRRMQVKIDSTTTTYWEYGDAQAEPLVLIHGFRGTHEGLDLIARALSDRFRVIAPDLPGFGQSENLASGNTMEAYTAWIRGLYQQLNLTDAPLLGHSFGSIVVSAAAAAGLAPRRLVLINPISQPALQGPQRLGSLAALGYYRAAAMLPEGAARSVLSSALVVRAMSEVMAKTHDDGLRRWIHGQHRAYFSVFDSPSGLLEAFHASITHDVSEYARALRLPVLVIAGDRDDIVPLGAQRALVRSLPDARLEIAAGVGHLVHYEAWSETARWVADFLSGSDPVGGSGPVGNSDMVRNVDPSSVGR